MVMKFYLLVAIVITSAILGAGATADAVEPIGGDMGMYRIHCNVEGAGVSFDREFKGNITSGILDVPVYITGTPYRSFSIEKEGYYPYSGQFTVVPAKGSVVDIYATMSAIPPVEYGTLHLLVTPVLSSVSFDGKSMGLVPETGILIIRNVVPGNHVVKVTKQGYADTTKDVHVSKNEIKKASITMPAEESVSVTADGATAPATQDTGASVTKGSSIGLSPFTLMGALLGAFLLLALKRYPR
jgi:PEGA domain